MACLHLLHLREGAALLGKVGEGREGVRADALRAVQQLEAQAACLTS